MGDGVDMLFRGGSEEYQRENHAKAAVALDAAVTNSIVVAGGMSPATARKSSAAAGYGDRPSLRWLYDAFPNFPVRLKAMRVPLLHTVSVMHLLGGKLAQTPFYREFTDFLHESETAEDTPHGLVFPWGVAGVVIIHNAGAAIWDVSRVIDYTAPDKKSCFLAQYIVGDAVISVCPFSNFLRALTYTCD